MTTTPVLATISFWRLLLERLGRQAAQTAVPLLAVIVQAGGQVDIQSIGLALAGSLAVTLVKALLLSFVDLSVDSNVSLPWQLIDRAVPAFAGVFAGLWPTTAAGLVSFHFTAALYAALGAAVTAILAVYVTPPALATRSVSGAYKITTLPGDESNGSLR